MGRGGSGSNAQSKAFAHCLIDYADDISKCQIYMDRIVECGRTDVDEICSAQAKAFKHCLIDYGNDKISNLNISECQFYMDRVKECVSKSASS